MIATYRLQLTPDFGFDDLKEQLPYLRDLGISHLYLSPITEAAPGSTHGYDVADHNEVRADFGGREAFESLRVAALEHGLSLVLDFVPNHAGVGPDNASWQDVLTYGPSSTSASVFDIDWNPLKPELRGKILLPFLGRPYGEVLDAGEIRLVFDAGYVMADYYGNRFPLSPATYSPILQEALSDHERQEVYFDLLDLHNEYQELAPLEREKGEALKARLVQLVERLDLEPALQRFSGERLHELLERQFWRLAYWKTAGDEINYRRFFDVNGLVALRMEEQKVFWDSHRLLGELLLEDGVDGVRIDHVDGLFDPHGYLDSLAALGPNRIWVEKILAPGETLPEEWPVSGTTGYEFMNDVLRILAHPQGETPILRIYRNLVEESLPWHEEVVRCKRLVMETSLAGELTRLANDLYRLSEADYHTRDFTLTALRDALADIIASFDRYRTYLPRSPEEAREVITHAVSEAKRRAQNVETSVYDFIRRCLTETFPENLEAARLGFVGRFQQYTAPVAAKGVEDTAFYRYVPLVALNEVGGEPGTFTIEPQVFHSRARFRQHRYPDNLLATATHDHKRGEDTRMRLIALAELHDLWQDTVARLDERAQRYWRDGTPLGATRIESRDAYLFYQHLTALWVGEEPERLADRLVEYMRKALREAKEHSSWIDPDETYEGAALEFVRAMTVDPEVAEIVDPLAREIARYGFLNGLSQLVLKLTTPGVPDIYQGTELLDLSLVDPDNRRPVDFARRRELLGELQEVGRSDPAALTGMAAEGDERLKILLLNRLLRFRKENPEPFAAPYRPLSATGEHERGVIAYAREGASAQLLVVVPRFPVELERHGGWGDTALGLPESLQGEGWQDVVTGLPIAVTAGSLELAELPFLPAVLHRAAETSL